MKTIRISGLQYASRGYHIYPYMIVEDTRVGNLCIATPRVSFNFIYYIR